VSGPRVVDRRSVGARWAQEHWTQWAARPPFWLAAAAALTDPIRRRILAGRVRGRPAPPADRLVVSVGNLRLGGTGKTPLVIDTVRRLAAQGVTGAVLTRGYASERRGPCIVDSGDAACGDEARLMARSFPWPVIQAADRAAGLAAAIEATAPGDVVILEDAHQSAGLSRHRDLLILDRWGVGTRGRATPETGRPLPWGPYREDAAGADRADALIVEADAGSEPEAELADGRPVCAFRRRGVRPAGFLDCEAPYGVLSGLARPEGFERTCAEVTGRAPVLVARFDDHAAFRSADAAALQSAGADLGVADWLTTGKDHGKLVALWPEGSTLHEVGLELEWAGRTPADLIVDWLAART